MGETLPFQRAPDALAMESQLHDLFEAGLGQLPDMQRTVLILRDIHEESFADIARDLGISVNCVKAHLSYARKTMRRILEPFLDNPYAKRYPHERRSTR